MKPTLALDGSGNLGQPQHDRVADVAARRAALAGPSGIPGLVRNLRLTMIACCVSMGGFCYGYEQGAYSQVLVMPSFTNNPAFKHIADDATYKGWSVSTLGLGGWLGALMNGYLCDRLSRRWTLFVAGLICLLGTGLTTGAQNTVYMFVGRFFIGVSVGSLSAAVPLYNSEISSPELRGTLVAIQQLAIVWGICISFWIGYGTNFISDTNSVSWRLPLAIQGVPALLLCFFCLFIPYTPRWLVKQGRLDEAISNLAYLRNATVDDELVQLEFMEIQAEAIFEEEIARERFPQFMEKGGLNGFRMQLAHFTSLFSSKHMFRRTATACLMQFFQQMSGIDCIVYYAPTIFASLGLKGNEVSLLASGVVGVVFVISMVPALYFIDKVGRRPLLFTGGIMMAMCLIIVAALTAQYQSSWSTHQGAAWTAAAFIWIYVTSFGFSWGPCSWVVISEVFPLSVRSYGVALGASTNWMINFVVSIIVPIMLQNITYGTYLVFLCFMLMGLGYVKWILPETYRRSLEEMDFAFGSLQGTAELQRMNEIQERLALEGSFGSAGAQNTDGDEKVDARIKERV